MMILLIPGTNVAKQATQRVVMGAAQLQSTEILPFHLSDPTARLAMVMLDDECAGERWMGWQLVPSGTCFLHPQVARHRMHYPLAPTCGGGSKSNAMGCACSCFCKQQQQW